MKQKENNRNEREREAIAVCLLREINFYYPSPPFSFFLLSRMMFNFSAFRYWAVTNVDYIHSRTTGRVLTMIFFVWVSAVIVSLAPQFGWKDAEYMQRIEQLKCVVSQDVGYQVSDHLFGESIFFTKTCYS